MGKWIKYRRTRGETSEPVARVSIRPNFIAFNAHFVGTANLAKKPHVTVSIDPELFRIGFQFHESAERESLTLTRDGGSGGRGRGLCFAVAPMMREHSWLAAVGNIRDKRLRQFEPKWSSTDSMWVVALSPSFEHRVSDRSDIPSQTCRIYRYKRGDEIVYIGRGQIRSRLGSQERAGWDFETVEYSIVPDEDQQAHWETHWLDAFVAENGRLPIYNRISGTRPAKADEGDPSR